MNNVPDDQHVERRESVFGRWMPAAFYSLNVALWLTTALAFEAWDLLHLTLLTLPWLAIYLWRTRRAE